MRKGGKTRREILPSECKVDSHEGIQLGKNFRLSQAHGLSCDLILDSLTLNFSVSFSKRKLELSEIAFAQIGAIGALSSADKELFGLPERTKACVPVKIMS
jgi:hypothetical protein